MKSIDEHRLTLRKQIFFKKIMEIKEKQIKQKTENDIKKKFKDLDIPDEIKFADIPTNVNINYLLNFVRRNLMNIF